MEKEKERGLMHGEERKMNKTVSSLFSTEANEKFLMKKREDQKIGAAHLCWTSKLTRRRAKFKFSTDGLVSLLRQSGQMPSERVIEVA